jgi:hypothetical protein
MAFRNIIILGLIAASTQIDLCAQDCWAPSHCDGCWIVHETSSGDCCPQPVIQTESTCSPCSGYSNGQQVRNAEPCNVITNHPEYGPIGGRLDEIRFPKPKLTQVGNLFSLQIDGFEVVTEHLCGSPSEYVVVAGIIKTNGASLRSEIELQAEPLHSTLQPIRVQPQNIGTLDERTVVKMFIRLVHSKSRTLIAKQDSEDWLVKDLLKNSSESPQTFKSWLPVRLPY